MITTVKFIYTIINYKTKKQMKLIRSILALIVFVGFSFSMTAQNVTINKSQVTLETVLDDLSRQTGFEFLHSRPTVNPDEIVSLNVSDVSLETALQKLFSNKPIGYEIKDSKVYLIAKDTPDTPKKDEKVVVTGTIVDATGLPVIGAGVIVKGTTRGVSAGLDGDFSIEVDPSETLLFSSIGYDDVEILVKHGKLQKYVACRRSKTDYQQNYGRYSICGA